MHYTPLISAALLGASLVSAAPVSPNPALDLDLFLVSSVDTVVASGGVERRDTCNADNLLRLLRTPTNLPQAIPFCSSYLGIPLATVTVTTVTPVVTATVTNLHTETQTAQVTITNTNSVFLTSTQDVVVATITNTVTQQPNKARAAASKAPLSETVLSSYSADRISSACGCISVTTSTVSVTATAATSVQTNQVEATVDVTITQTATAAVTQTLNDVVTASQTATSVVTVSPPSPTFYATFNDPATGQKSYLKPFSYPIGELYVLTADKSQATTFWLNNQNQMQTFSSSKNSLLTVFRPSAFDANPGSVYVQLAADDATITTGPYVGYKYQWTIDGATNQLTTDHPNIVQQLCSTGAGWLWASSPTLGSTCVRFNPVPEYIS